MKTTTFALSLLLSQYAIVDGQLANTAQRRVSPTDRFTDPSHKQQRRTLRTTRTLEVEDGSMSLATSMSMMAVEPEAKDMYETTEENIEAVEPTIGGGYDGVDPQGSGSAKGGKTSKTSKATKLFKPKAEKTVDAKAEKASKATKAKGEKMR